MIIFILIFIFSSFFSLHAHDRLTLENAEIIDMVVYKKGDEEPFNGLFFTAIPEDEVFMETEIKNTPKAFRPEVQIREFKNFLSLIKSNM